MKFKARIGYRTPSGPAALALHLLERGLPAFLIGCLVGVIVCSEGTPWVAFPLIVGAFTLTGLIVTALGLAPAREAGASPSMTQKLIAIILAARKIPKATQFLIIAFCVTSVFAVELRFDIVPNRYGFLELLLPIAISAILFDASSGLFCAALTAAYAFQALAPPRFAPVLESNVSFPLSLSSFAFTALLCAIFFAYEARILPGRAGLANEFAGSRSTARKAGRTLAGALRHALSSTHTHVMPGALLVLAYALVWSLFATISSGRGLHGDSLEAYAWGREFVFGYYKHPPFWSWVAGAWFTIMPKTNWSFWFLSELNGALGLAGAWALIGRFTGRRMQMLGILLLMLTPFYQFNAQRFNANTILLSIWPWTLYFFVRSLETRALFHACVCGLLAGLAVLSKYFGVILIATCFLASLTHHDAKAYYRSATPYVSALVAFLVFTPHLAWLFRDGFQPFIYLAARIDFADRAISNRYFEFVLANAAFFILPAAVLLAARWRGGRETIDPPVAQRHGRSFLNVLTFTPFVLTLVSATIGHAALGVPFAVPIFALIPLSLMLAIAPAVSLAKLYARVGVATLAAACLIAAPFLPGLYLRMDEKHYSEPRDEIADEAMAIWAEKTHAPLRFVGGVRDYAMAVTFRSRDNVSEFNNFNFRWSPWVTPWALADKGLLIICQSGEAVCNDNAATYMRDDTLRIERVIQRSAGGVEGRPWAFSIYVIPPAQPAR